MKELNPKDLNELPSGIPPCITLYWSGTDTLSFQSRLRFAGLLKEATSLLMTKLSLHQVEELLSQLRKIQKGEYSHLLTGPFVVFRSQDTCSYIRLAGEQKDEVIVADSFHIKPVQKYLHRYQKFLVLTMSRNRIRLFSGSAFGIVKIGSFQASELINAKEHQDDIRITSPIKLKKQEFLRFIHTAEKKFWPLLRSQTCPLILAGPASLTSSYRGISSYPFVLEKGVDVNVDKFAFNKIHKITQEIATEYFDQEKERVITNFNDAISQKKTLRDVSQIARAAVDGRVSALLIAEDTKLWGMLDRKTGNIEVHPRQLDLRDDDVLDDLAELVYRGRGQVWVVPQKAMPVTSPAAAILRW